MSCLWGLCSHRARCGKFGSCVAAAQRKAIINGDFPSRPAEKKADDWRDDPTSEEQWNAGVDFAMKQLCSALDVKPDSITWDAATETVEGDIQSVMWNILRASGMVKQ